MKWALISDRSVFILSDGRRKWLASSWPETFPVQIRELWGKMCVCVCIDLKLFPHPARQPCVRGEDSRQS